MRRASATPQDMRIPTVFTRLMSTAARPNASPGWSWATRPCAARPAGRRRTLPHRHEHHLRDIRGRTARPYLAGRLTVRPQQTRPCDHGGAARIRPDLIFEQPAGQSRLRRRHQVQDHRGRLRQGRRLLPDPRLHTGPRRPAGHADLLPARRRRPAHSHPRRHAPDTPRHLGTDPQRDTCDIEHRLKDLANRIVERADIRLQASAPRTTF